MMSKFVNEIEWSSERYSLENFLKSFPLPQVVKVRRLPSSTSRSKRDQISFFEEIVVLHSVRDIKIIRATDSFKNEFFLPKDAKAKVEVIWKDYKKVYDSVKKLSEDFPAYVLVMEGDNLLIGIQKGDVLKLKQTITSRDSKCLQCDVVNGIRKDINIPFGYKGLFKTLGDLTQEHILLSDAIQHCKLPRVVKFIDNKLKMKKVDGLSSQPLPLRNQEVTLHEAINYSDVIACKTIIESVNHPGICVMTIPLDSGVEVLAPTASSRSDSRYSQLCTSINKTVSADMINKLAIQNSHWIVYEVEDNNHHHGNRRSSVLSSSSSRNSPPKATIKSVIQNVSVNDSQGRELFRGGDVDEEQPPLPPRDPIPLFQQRGHRSFTLLSTRGSKQKGFHPSARKTKSLNIEHEPVGFGWKQGQFVSPSNGYLPSGSSPTSPKTNSMFLDLPTSPLPSRPVTYPSNTSGSSPTSRNTNSMFLDLPTSPLPSRPVSYPSLNTSGSSPTSRITNSVLLEQPTSPLPSRPPNASHPSWRTMHFNQPTAAWAARPRMELPNRETVPTTPHQDGWNSNSSSLDHSSSRLPSTQTMSTSSNETFEIVNYTNHEYKQEEEERPASVTSRAQERADDKERCLQLEIIEDDDGYVKMTRRDIKANSSAREIQNRQENSSQTYIVTVPNLPHSTIPQENHLYNNVDLSERESRHHQNNHYSNWP